MVEPERALFLHSPPKTLPTGITRVYAGAEFCPWRLPEPAALRRLLDWARDHDCAFTLTTPVLIEPLRARFSRLLTELLPQFSPQDELVISDWGTLELARAVNPEVRIAVGRTLSGQKRDPVTTTLNLDGHQLRHFRSSRWHSAPAVAMLLELKIGRVELDNLLQGLEPLPAPLLGSLHTPFAMVAASRNCPFRSPGRSNTCPQPCGEVFSLNRDDLPSPLLQGGNTQFINIATLPANLGACRIDRVVEHLELPH